MAAPYLLIAARADTTLEDRRHLLLKAWRERKVVRVAELVILASHALDTKTTKTSPPRSPHVVVENGDNDVGGQRAWLEVAGSHDARELGGLLTSIVVTSRPRLSLERLSRLRTWPEDPRIAIGLLAIVGARPFARFKPSAGIASSPQQRPFYRRLFAELDRRADRSTLPTIDALLARLGSSNATAFDLHMSTKLRALRVTIEAQRIVEAYAHDLRFLDAIAASIAAAGPLSS